MASVLHGSARTRPHLRAEFQASKGSSWALAARYRLNAKTVRKWRKRTTTGDALMGPKKPKSTVLTPVEEAIVVAFRQKTLLPLDDVLGCLRDAIPHLSRSAFTDACNATASSWQSCRGEAQRRPRSRSHLRRTSDRSRLSQRFDRRQGLRRRRLHRPPRRSSDRPGHPIQIQPKNPASVRFRPLPRTQSHRAFLQHAQAFPGHRHALRQTRQDVPRRRSPRLHRHPPQMNTGPSVYQRLLTFTGAYFAFASRCPTR